MISKGKPVMVGDEYYDVRCLSTDVKPTKQIKNGSLLIEIDTGKRYLFDYEQKAWNEVPFDSGAAPATTSTAGIVKPDGKTIDVSQDGTISIATEGDGAIRSVTAEGWAEQDTTTGKNLLFQRLSNMNIDTSGTILSSQAGYDLHIARVTKGTTYALGSSGSGFAAIWGIYASVPTAGSVAVDNVRHVESINTFTPSQDGYVAVRSTAGAARIQLELGSTATSYEPYTGGAPSPSPDYPQEIQVARGRNLLDESKSVNGKVVNSTTGTEVSNASYRHSGYTPVEANTTYYMSNGLGINTMYSGAIYDANKQYLRGITFTGAYTQSGSFDTGADAAYVILNYYSPITDKYVAPPQLESGSTPTPYVPYGHVGLEVRGRNLLRLTLTDKTVSGVTFTVNADGSITANGTATANIYKDIGRGNPQSENVILTGCPSGGSSSTYFMYIAGYGDTSGYDTGNGGTIPSARQNNSTRIVIMSGVTCDNLVFRPMLRLASVSDSTYVPYHDDVTIPIPLPSKGFAASLPDGTHDTLTIDGAGHVEWESATNEVTFDGSSDETWGWNSQGFAYTVQPSDCATFASPAESTVRMMVDRFILSTVYNPGNAYASGNNLLFWYGIGSFNPSNAAEAKAWAADNPITVLYPLVSPTTEDCGYVDLQITTEGDTVSIPELEDVAVVRWADAVATEVAQAWYRRASAVESRVAALEAAVAEIVANG